MSSWARGMLHIGLHKNWPCAGKLGSSTGHSGSDQFLCIFRKIKFIDAVNFLRISILSTYYYFFYVFVKCTNLFLPLLYVLDVECMNSEI